MQPTTPPVDAIARRAELQHHNRDLLAQIARLNAVKSERDSARAAVEELVRKDAEALATWAINGAKGVAPETDQKTRAAAAQKLAAAESQAAAVDRAIEKLTQQHLELHAELQTVGGEILVLRAQHLGRLLTELTAKRRELEDECVTSDAVARRIYDALFAADQRTGGNVTGALEAERVTWLNIRGAQIEQEVARRWAEIAKDLPA